mmetsp:Transcript_19905/g.50199  ORF Transcript_19905/g.50199 Transcript_19905/m.50199 type:complete len:224 (+) Transcript_19905:130-801(+)
MVATSDSTVGCSSSTTARPDPIRTREKGSDDGVRNTSMICWTSCSAFWRKTSCGRGGRSTCSAVELFLVLMLRGWCEGRGSAAGTSCSLEVVLPLALALLSMSSNIAYADKSPPTARIISSNTETSTSLLACEKSNCATNLRATSSSSGKSKMIKAESTSRICMPMPPNVEFVPCRVTGHHSSLPQACTLYAVQVTRKCSRTCSARPSQYGLFTWRTSCCRCL